MDFKPYYNNWLDVSALFLSATDSLRKEDLLPVDLDVSFFDNLIPNNKDYSRYRIDAAVKASEILGSKPALCFSGGADSQAMLQCWLEAGLKFDLFILVFENNLNAMDVDHAREFCKKFNVTLNEIEIDIIKFLNFNNYEYGIKYSSCSPHFNTHYKLFNILKDMGYTGVCSAGDAPHHNSYNNSWGGNYTRNPNTFIKYSEVSNFPCIGNFIGYYPQLAWSVGLNTLPSYMPTLEGLISNTTQRVYKDQFDMILSAQENIHKGNINERYEHKCSGYESVGFTIIPQAQKYTGFETVKTHLENKTGDGWEFEKRYRQPLEKLFLIQHADPIFTFKEGVKEKIMSIYSNNFTTL